MAIIKGIRIINGNIGAGFNFSFPLSVESSTSAGVYLEDDTLVRTLWGNVKYPSGTNYGTWDGLLEDGSVAQDGNYHVKVLDSTVIAEWEGAAIGQSATALTGNTKLSSYKEAQSIAISNGNLYIAFGYMERRSAIATLPLNNIGVAYAGGGGGGQITNHPEGSGQENAQVTEFVEADATNVYWAGFDTEGNNYVFATKVSDNSEVSFPEGSTVSTGTYHIYSALSNKGGYIKGLALQKTGNYIFVSRNNEIDVCDKVTGGTIRTIGVPYCNRITCDNSGNLWVYRNSRPYTSGSASYENSYPYIQAFDGNLSTGFHSASNSANQSYVQIDSIYPQTSTSVRIYHAAGSEYRMVGVKIEAYVVNSWVTLHTITVEPTGVYTDYAIPSTTTTLWRLVQSADEYLIITEVQFYTPLTPLNQIEKYTVNSDGTITSEEITITDIVEAEALRISYDGAKLAVIDKAPERQTVRFYDNSDGSFLSTFGQAGGYYNSSTVENDKWLLSTKAGIARNNVQQFAYLNRSDIAFDSDNSYWILDSGNIRFQHFSASNDYIESIYCDTGHLEVFLVANDENRLFAELKEYEVDHTQPVQQSWTLKNNWGANFTSLMDNISNVVTLNNGKTYCLIARDLRAWSVDDNIPQIGFYELIEGGGIRYTGVSFNFQDLIHIDRDGRKVMFDWFGTVAGGGVIYYPLIGFDGSANPIWSNTYQRYTENFTDGYAFETLPINFSPLRNAITDSGKMIFFQRDKSDNVGQTDYHLGAIELDSGHFKWRTSRGTLRSYFGDSPKDGFFDNGNESTYAASDCQVLGNLIFWNEFGEFNKQEQTNYYRMFHESGLFVCLFGAHRKDYPKDDRQQPFCEGNVQRFAVTRIGNTVYLYYGGEGLHSGISRVKITNVDSIRVRNFQLTNIVIPSKPYIELGRNLVRSADITTYDGWTLSNPQEANVWGVGLGQQITSPFLPADIFLVMNGANLNRYLDRDLLITNDLSSWKLTAKINHQFSSLANSPGGLFIELLDNVGKVITRVTPTNAPSDSVSMIANDTALFTVRGIVWGTIKYKFLLFEVSVDNAGLITFKYHTYITTTNSVAEVGANKFRPTTLRLRLSSMDGGTAFKSLSAKELRFYPQ